MEQKKAVQNAENTQSKKQKKQSIYTNHGIDKITGSKPMIFSPPEPESTHVMINDDLKNNDTEMEHTENEEMKKKDRDFHLMKEFTYLLQDDSSVHEESSSLEQHIIDNEAFEIWDESSSLSDNVHDTECEHAFEYESNIEDQCPSKQEDSDTLVNEFYSMLNEGFEHETTNGEEIDSSYEKIDTYEDPFISSLSDSNELLEEKEYNTSTYVKEKNSDNKEELSEKSNFEQSNLDDLLGNGSNSSSIDLKDPSIENHSESKENASLLHDHFIDQLREISPNNDELSFSQSKPNEISVKKKKDEKERTIDSKMNQSKKKRKRKYFLNRKKHSKLANLKEDPSEHPCQKDTFFIDCIEKKQTTTVKMAVLLAKLEIDIDIVETIDLLMLLENITKVDWSMKSLDCKVVLPSTTVFLKGELVADIQYTNKGLENTIHSLKVPIPWSKKTNIHWLTSPELSYRRQNEFIFHSQHNHSEGLHYESYEKFTEPIHSVLNRSHFVWHQELHPKDQQLHVNGTVNLYIHLMQDQFVELQCYSD